MWYFFAFTGKNLNRAVLPPWIELPAGCCCIIPIQTIGSGRPAPTWPGSDPAALLAGSVEDGEWSRLAWGQSDWSSPRPCLPCCCSLAVVIIMHHRHLGGTSSCWKIGVQDTRWSVPGIFNGGSVSDSVNYWGWNRRCRFACFFGDRYSITWFWTERYATWLDALFSH